MQFKRLRLTGFKSFVETTDILVDTGLTGVVGPNGCGKSNLVEALRWVMGESSARQMRGREMDDLIFNGSESRPRRNHGEVSLLLDKILASRVDGAKEFGINSTPTFIVNGEKLVGNLPYEQFVDVFERLLSNS